MSLRMRLLIATGLAVLCGLIVVDLITFSVVTGSLVQQVDDTLQRAHAPIEQVAESRDPDAWNAIPAIAPGLFVSIVDRDGTELFTAPAIEPGREQDVVDTSEIDLSERYQTARAIDGDSIRLRVDPLADGQTLIVDGGLSL